MGYPEWRMKYCCAMYNGMVLSAQPFISKGIRICHLDEYDANLEVSNSSADVSRFSLGVGIT